MIDPVKILQRAWHILWNYRALWVFGLILALAAGGGSGGNGGNNGMQWREDSQSYQAPPPESMQEFFNDFNRELEKLFRQGIPEVDITGEALTAFLWIVGIFVVFMLMVGIVMAIARYVSETAVIRMVDEYENTGTKMTVREGFRIGWSRAAWRLFLINLIVNLPVILFFLVLLIAGAIILVIIGNVGDGNTIFTPVTIIAMIGLVFLAIFVVVILSILLGLLRHFFWRVAVLEDAGVGESLRRGFAMVRQNWKSVGLMWLVMIGLGIAWMVVSIIAIIITLPVVFLTSIAAAIVVAIPGLLLVGLFSLFLGGPLPWIAAALFVLPLFFIIAFSPWLLLGSWQAVFTSNVWTLTYREIKALPALAPEMDLEPVGD
ncbi:MAG: hypothetical protein EHM33_29685 [Chloroflexi bacterium]|nr:MAG: hypothetical protein EHM33_29685 [Chloroflexota bacterium]